MLATSHKCMLKISFYLKSILVLALVLAMFNSSINSQEPNLRFRNLSTKDGLSYITVTSFFQDSKGRMWIGTPDGLNMFNAQQFQVYKHDEKNSNSLLNNEVYSIIEDATIAYGLLIAKELAFIFLKKIVF